MTECEAATVHLRATVQCALFTALIIVGGYISIPIPIGPVPIVLTDLFVMLAGILLGHRYALASTAMYLTLGALGLPVFAGGGAGLAHLIGPTGGFLLGYLPLCAATGYISSKLKPTKTNLVCALTVGNLLLYAIGIPWLKYQMGLSWAVALSVGLAPFLIGIIIKIIVATALGLALLPRYKQSKATKTIRQNEI
ncbi:MAG: biotin transporter BioY [Coriobacteriales bacterium]|jgi:biotin transport system substrate-specific component|nr:biotin transporter BioY [Coriobacteriales bacterium]